MEKISQAINKHQLIISILVLNSVLCIIYTPTHYYFEMFQSMAFQFLFICIVTIIFFTLNKSWLGVMTCFIALTPLLNHLAIFQKKSIKEPNTTIAHFNVLKHNNKYTPTINAALKTNADLISFNEVSPLWALKLEGGLKKEYPFYKIQLAPNNSFGIAIFSKHSLCNVKVHYWGSENIPTITGTTILANQPINFIAAHTIPPTSKDAYSIRNNHLNEIKNFMKNIEGHKVLIGDLNAVSWSASLRAMKNENQLKDSRTSWMPTYPSWNRFFAIPIDHIFYSKDFICTNFETIKSTKSDHFGIKASFLIEN